MDEQYLELTERADKVKEEILRILDDGRDISVSRQWDSSKGTYYELNISNMYDEVEISFKDLLDISALFGTTEIDKDLSAAYPGCDTCGWGSEYNTDIQIYNPTKNLDVLEMLVGEKLK